MIQVMMVYVLLGTANVAYLYLSGAPFFGALIAGEYAFLCVVALLSHRKMQTVSGTLARAAAVSLWRRVMFSHMAYEVLAMIATAIFSEFIYVFVWAFFLYLTFTRYRNDKDGGNPFKGLGTRIKDKVASMLPSPQAAASPA